MNFSDRELWLLQGAINGECIKLLKKKKLQYIKVVEEYEVPGSPVLVVGVE